MLKKALICYFLLLIIIFGWFRVGNAADNDSTHVVGSEESVKVSIEKTEIKGVKKAIVEGVLDIDICRTWKAILSLDRWHGIKEKIVEYNQNDTLIIYSELDLPTIFLANRKYVLKCVADNENYIFSWTHVKDRGNIKECYGVWELSPVDSSGTRTYAKYTVYSDPGLKMIPRFLVDWATKNALPNLIPELYERALRQEECP